jgi:hypothetical protein
MVGGKASWVDFHASGVWNNVTVVSASTAPDCVDCTSRTDDVLEISGAFVIATKDIKRTGQQWQQDVCEQECEPFTYKSTTGITVS